MIVISGALVLVALVLLIIGVVGPDLTFVYASIGVSLVSLVFLVIGILQRRGETAPAAEGASAAAPTPVTVAEPDGATAVAPAQETRVSSVRLPKEKEPAVAESVDAEPPTGGIVLVVQGRPRYHVAGCRYLSGKTTQPVEVADARDEGFTPCGVCKPDDALVAMESTAPIAIEPVEEPVAEPVFEAPVVEEDVPGVEVAPTIRRTARTAKAPAKKAPARVAKAPAKIAAAPAARAPRKAPLAEPLPVDVVAPSRTPGRAAAAAATPAAAGKRAGSVVVIPDRGKYHRAECRYVRDVPGAEVMSKTAASRQGYAACGVCKP